MLFLSFIFLHVSSNSYLHEGKMNRKALPREITDDATLSS